MEMEDHRPAATVDRLADMLDLCFRALSRGIQVADAMHAEHRWDTHADPHMHPHIVRREALELLKAQNPDAEAGDNLGAAMSGLRVLVGTTDVLRVWHGYDGTIRVPSTDSGRAFLKQPASTATYLPGFEEPAVRAQCNTVLVWEHKDGVLSRFTLMRPLDVESGHVVADWQEPLLLRFSERMDDVQYKRRQGDAGQAEQTS